MHATHGIARSMHHKDTQYNKIINEDVLPDIAPIVAD